MGYRSGGCEGGLVAGDKGAEPVEFLPALGPAEAGGLGVAGSPAVVGAVMRRAADVAGQVDEGAAVVAGGHLVVHGVGVHLLRVRRESLRGEGKASPA